MIIGNVAEFFGLSLPELIIIMAILLLLFGGKKLPELARSIGGSVNELRKGIDDGAKPKSDANTKSDS